MSSETTISERLLRVGDTARWPVGRCSLAREGVVLAVVEAGDSIPIDLLTGLEGGCVPPSARIRYKAAHADHTRYLVAVQARNGRPHFYAPSCAVVDVFIEEKAFAGVMPVARWARAKIVEMDRAPRRFGAGWRLKEARFNAPVAAVSTVRIDGGFAWVVHHHRQDRVDVVRGRSETLRQARDQAEAAWRMP
jgi:hypothetical protein